MAEPMTGPDDGAIQPSLSPPLPAAPESPTGAASSGAEPSPGGPPPLDRRPIIAAVPTSAPAAGGQFPADDVDDGAPAGDERGEDEPGDDGDDAEGGAVEGGLPGA